MRTVGARELNPLLLEETIEWDQELDWDFTSSAHAIRSYAEQRGLEGAAIIDRNEVAGYGYSVLEGEKGLIGDLYVRPGWRRDDAEVRLLRVLIDGMIQSNLVRRIEAQPMLLDERVAQALAREHSVKLFERMLMRMDASITLPARDAVGAGRFRYWAWEDSLMENSAQMLEAAYRGHIDAQINDLYSSVAGSVKFAHSIVKENGCGEFCPAASFLATDAGTGQAAGVVLSSFVSSEVAHVAQLCVAPEWQGAGLGYELLRRAVAAAVRGGAERVSLTVTLENRKAVQLYRRCGFREIRRFFAYSWEE